MLVRMYLLVIISDGFEDEHLGILYLVKDLG